MLSLEELRRAGRWLDLNLRGHRVQEIVQADSTSVVFTLYGRAPEAESGKRRHLILACGPDTARVSMLRKAPSALPTPPAFCQYLRAHVLNAEVRGFRLIGEERQLAMKLRTREGEFDLLLAIFGRRSNVVLLDTSDHLVATLRPLRETRPELSLGGEWRAPESPPPKAGSDRFAEFSDDEYLCAVEAAYSAAHEQSENDALESELERVLRKQVKAYERKLDKVAETLAEAEKASGLERAGELLKANLASVRRGDDTVSARDFETGEEVVIELDPKLSPAENLARIFKRYQKAVRSLAKAGAQQDEMRAVKRSLDDLEAERASLRDSQAAAAFSERPEIAKLLRKYARKDSAGAPRSPGSDASKPLKVGKMEVPRRLMPRRYRTAGDLEVWVGRSDEGNDLLTTRLAAGNDLFFHLDGAPGSHVILRTRGRADPPSEAILDACELAVHYSKAKNATRADVHIVPIKNVKKPKGAKRGLVMVHGGRTFHLRRMRTRLDQVLAARIEEN